MERNITEIIIHCTATNEGVNVTAADVDRWHKQRGWQGIGYHYLIRINGAIEVGRGESEIGAHTFGHNARSIGVCYVGGLRKGKAADTRTPEQKEKLLSLVKSLCKRFPNARVSGHSQWAKKACPCFDVVQWAKDNGIPYDDTINRI